MIWLRCHHRGKCTINNLMPSDCWSSGNQWQRIQHVNVCHCQGERHGWKNLSGWWCMRTSATFHTRWEKDNLCWRQSRKRDWSTPRSWPKSWNTHCSQTCCGSSLTRKISAKTRRSTPITIGWLIVSHKDLPRIMQTKFPLTSMIFNDINRQGDIMPPHCLHWGLQAQCILSRVVNLRIDCVTAGWLYMWEQDSALCYTNWKTQTWLSESVNHNSRHIDLPACLTATPLTSLCGSWWNETNKSSCNTKDKLKTRITRARPFRDLCWGTVTKAFGRIRGCQRSQRRVHWLRLIVQFMKTNWPKFS